MAQIVTITNPLTGQPAQVDQLDHTAQEIDDGIGFESTDYPGCYYRTVDGVTEWVNPPLELGKEYRTTERYLGKPVYVKVIDCGNMPNNSKKIVCANIGPNVVDKYVYFSADNYLNQYDMTVLPVNELGTYYANARISMGRNSSTDLYEPYIELFGSNAWSTSYNCRATIKYTKIAD